MVNLEPLAPPDQESVVKAQHIFLEEFIKTHSRMKALQKAGIEGLRIIEQWIRDDPQFRAAYTEAQALLADQMEAAAFQRAVTGIDKPVFQGGECVGYIREYSDTLLTTLLKAKLPDQYGTARHTLDIGVMGGDHGPMPSPVTIEIVHEIGREFGQMLARRTGEPPGEQAVPVPAKVETDADTAREQGGR